MITPQPTPRSRGPLITPHDIGAAILAGLEQGRRGGIDVGANDHEFVKKYDLRFDGASIAGPRGLGGDYKHLVKLYEDNALEQTLMAAAQSGKSLWLMVHMARMALLRWGKQFGYYFPVYDLLAKFSDTRFRPFLRSNAITGRLLGSTMRNSDGTTRKGKDATESMSLGESYFHFLLTSGLASTEGMPFSGVAFDELRRMAPGDVERAQKRYSAQQDPIDIKVSTPRYPDQDIHAAFLLGDQQWFHSECECAGDAVVLARTFPECVADLSHATPLLMRKVERAFDLAGVPLYGFRSESEHAKYAPSAYICPSCGEILADPRHGYWEAEEPGRYQHSWQMPKMLTVSSPAGRLLYEYARARDVQEFWNSEIGVPFIDRTKMPIQHAHIDACVDGALPWGMELTDADRRRRLTNCAMGIDVQGGYGVCVIKKLMPSAKSRVVHVELLEGFTEDGIERSWWHRAAKLMHMFDVRYCVIDSLPEFVPALNFVKMFSGRAFLARFKEMPPGEFVKWDDVTLDHDAKQQGGTAVRHMVSLDRTRVIEWSLSRWKGRMTEMPHPGRLLQKLPQDNRREVVFSEFMRLGHRADYPVPMLLREQLTRYIFRDLVTDDPDASPESKRKAEVQQRRGKTKRVAEATGRDDFAMADMYCSVAIDKMGLPSSRRPQ